jgi:glutamate synthase (NADPH/NADH) large chain
MRCSSGGEKMQLTYTVRNTHRAVGTRFSARITEPLRHEGALRTAMSMIRLRGSAGQSLGAFLCKGVTLEVFGDANDYVGKGLSGGTIAVRPMVSSPLESQQHDHRQHRALRRDGGQAVRGGAGGRALRRPQLRRAGRGRRLRRQWLRVYDRRHGGHFGQGRREFRRGHDRRHGFRTGPGRQLCRHANPESIVWQRLDSAHWEQVLYGLIESHVEATGSKWSAALLEDWERRVGQFWQVCPKEMISRLAHPLSDRAEVEAAE